MSITSANHEVVFNSTPSPIPLTVVAVDTASARASYAVVRDGGLASSMVAGDGDRPSETLFGNLSRVLEEARVGLSEVDLFCGVVGPGSFTGLRVSLAALEGIAQTLKVPAIGYDTFDAWALTGQRTGQMKRQMMGQMKEMTIAIIAAGRGEVYVGRRIVGGDGDLLRLAGDQVGPPDKVLRQLLEESDPPVILLGDGLEIAGHVLAGIESAKVEVIRSGSPSLAAAIAEHAAVRPTTGDATREPRGLRPYYLRKPDAR